jgi:multidrug efflux pump
MSLSAPFIRRPIGTSLLAIGLFVAGAIAYFQLAVSALPQISFPAIFVVASQPGADASTMASTVAAPLERHLGQIPGVYMMRSHSSDGRTFVILIFDTGRDINEAAQEVQAAINASLPDLPSGLVAPPQYFKANPNDDPVVMLALTSDTEPLSKLYDRANTLLVPRLSQIQGVSNVDIAGSAQPAIRVDVNLHELNALGLSSNQLRNALRAANVTSPQGFLSNGQTTMAVTANDQLHSAEDFAGLVIAVRNGTPIRLRDVAHVYQGQEDTYQGAWFNRHPAILLSVYKQPGANLLDTVDAVKAQLPLMRTWLPQGTQLTPFFDGSPTVRASVNEVQITLLISLAMVILTMAVFLRRWAPTLIAATAVPLSLAGAFVVMWAFDYTLDNLSLLALVIAIAFVVDDAIVVIENIIRHVDAGKPRRQAALDGAREIGFTIVSITASLVAVFIPLLFASGMIGVFFREFTVTLIASIVVSAIVSLTLTPSLCGLFLRPESEGDGNTRLARALDAFHGGMLRVYKAALNWTLRHPLLVALQPLALIFLTVFLFGFVKFGFFPEQDTGLIWGRATSSASVSYDQMSDRLKRITDMLLADPAVKSVSTQLGSGRFGGSAAQFTIQLKALGHGRKLRTAAVLARLSAKADRYPDMNLRLRPIQDLPSGGGGGRSQGAQYSVSLVGTDLDHLQTWLPRLANQLKKNPMFKDVGSDADQAGYQEKMVVDREKASSMGISVAQVDDALYNAFGQRQVSTIYSDINQYKVVVNALPNQAATPEALKRIYVRGRDGMVPITAIAHLEQGLAPGRITHQNQMTEMDLSFNLKQGISLGEARTAIQKTIDNMRLPGDIRLSFGDSFRRLRDSQNSGLVLLLAALAAVYIVLGMLYENLIHPVTIMSTLPSAGVGALLALILTRTEMSVVAMMAIVLLIGLVKKNAIMMVDFALVAQRGGMEPREAIREACVVRFRPIMMTTMVAILAAVPLAVGLGEGAELRQPLGIAVIGGLVVSQALTLISTPALYVIFACLSARARARRERRREKRRLRKAAASRA